MANTSVLWKKIATLALAVLCLSLAVPSMSAAEELKLLSSWPQNMPFVKGMLEPFNKNLKELSGDAFKVKFFGPDVIPTVEQFEPVRAGVFDLLLTMPPYHMGTTAIGTAVDAIYPDPVKRRQAGIFDYVDKQYNKLGIKVIALIPVTDLNFLTRTSIAGNKPSFNGMKIRTFPTVIPVVKAMGGAPVNMQAGQVYTALQKGVIDGTAVITFGITDLKWNEVTKYMIRPTFGYLSGCILMSLKKYNSLTEKQRQVLDKAGAKTELDSMELFKGKSQAEEKKLLNLGLKIEQMLPEDAKRADKLYYDAIWTVTEKKSGKAVADLRKLAISKGLTK